MTMSGLWIPFWASLLAALVTMSESYLVCNFEALVGGNRTYLSWVAAGFLGWP